jgi:serine/threonine protein kinase/tetratricopeptide (TPR) repeat protein
MTSHDGLPSGATLGHYRIDRPLGHGGMGRVYLAHHTALHRRVALKVLLSAADGEAAHQQLLREARNAAALNHPNICTVYEVAVAEGQAFIAMEYVEGRPLSERLALGALPLDETLRYGAEAAEGLAYAHDHGVVHRDLKAANVIVTAAGHVKLVDFGLARRDDPLLAPAVTMATLASPGAATGTPYAMAPEQVRGAATDARTDVWALGVLLYEMATGAHPFSGGSLPELFSAILRDAPTTLPPGTPSALGVVIAQCLEKLPERRYRNAGEVVAAITPLARASVAPTAAPSGSAAAVSSTRTTILVLPFENLSGDPEQEYFSDGLTDETISALGATNPDSLRVVARTSSMAYKRTTKPVSQIGQEMRADYLLESSVRREAQRVRIASRLIRVADECQIWNDTFNRTPESVLGVQDEVSHAIAEAVRANLSLPTRAGTIRSRPSTQDAQAYDLTLRGRYNWHHFAIREAIECYKAAVACDPSYAPPYAGLAEAYAGMPIQCDADPLEYWDKARQAAARAKALAPELAEAHAADGWVSFFLGWDWPRALLECRRAIELNPNYAMGYFYLAHALSNASHHDEALALLRKARDLDPLSPIMYSFHAQFLFDARRYGEAFEPARRAVAMAPGFFHGHEILSRLHLQTGAFDEAIAECDQAHQLSGGMLFAFARKGHVLAKAGRRAEAEEVMRRLYRIAATRFVAPSHFAMIHAALGDRDQALGCLEAAFDVRAVQLMLLPTDPMWDEYRHEPRFQALMRRFHLPDRLSH